MKRLLIVCLAVAAAACQPPAPKPPDPIKVRAGTPVKLILANRLQSGRSVVGGPAMFVVAEDVVVGGEVAIPKGAVSVGGVTRSRREDGLDALTNTPARLEADLGVWTFDGVEVHLSAKPDQDAPYEFNRANTGLKNRTGNVDTAFSTAERKALAERVDALIESGQVEELDAKVLGDIAADLGLGELKAVVDKGETARATDLVRQIRQGSSIAALATGDGGLAFGAALQLLQIGGQVGNRLGRMLSGRNIVAHPGTEIEAYVLEDFSFVPKAKP